MTCAISIHAPARGATLHLGDFVDEDIFQSTPREGGDDYSQETKTDILGISIHTPREGGDVEGSKLWFNCNPISIHAPREGGDAAESTAKKLGLIFQSTPPARGATWVDRRWKDAIEFQSTPPARGATPRTHSRETD